MVLFSGNSVLASVGDLWRMVLWCGALGTFNTRGSFCWHWRFSSGVASCGKGRGNCSPNYVSVYDIHLWYSICCVWKLMYWSWHCIAYFVSCVHSALLITLTLNECVMLFNVFQRLTIPTSCPKSFEDLMRQCWQLDPVMRPSFRELLTYIEKMVDDDELRITTQTFLNHKKEWRWVTWVGDDDVMRAVVSATVNEEKLMMYFFTGKKSKKHLSAWRKSKESLVPRKRISVNGKLRLNSERKR